MGGWTGGTLGKAFVPFTFFCGTRGALGEPFLPFAIFHGTVAVGEGAKMSTFELDD